MEKKTKILFASSEVSPIAKVGGLADVVGSLPAELIKLGFDARVTVPKYDSIRAGELGAEKIAEIGCRFGPDIYPVAVYKARLPISNVPLYLIEEKSLLSKGPIYSTGRGGRNLLTKKFLFFCKAALESSEKIDFAPDIFHLHDWPTAPLCMMLQKAKKEGRLLETKSVLTIHNLNNQNFASFKMLAEAGLETEKNAVSPAVISRTNPEYLNLFASSLLSADTVNTVSPTYAREIYTRPFGAGLEKILKTRKQKVAGILNGIDTKYFDPSRDEFLAAKFDVKNISRRPGNKKNLQKILGLKENKSAFVCGVVTRLNEQKGIELVLEAMKKLLPEGDCQFAILGSGEDKYREMISALQKRHPKKLSFSNRYDSHLAKKIYAGSDVFLMPSKFEPCGLAQLIAMRYGSIPIVRDTGGLHDTVANYDEKNGRGFTFKNFTFESFYKSLKTARRLFYSRKLWGGLQARAMKADFSWSRSAKFYQRLYRQTLLEK